MILPHNLHYFSKTVNREVKEAYWFSAINALALALTYIFEPIFLYKLGYDFIHILFFYLIVYICYAVLVIPVTSIASRFGYKHSIFFAAVAYVVYWCALYFVSFYPSLLFVAALLLAIQKSLFWPAYNADIALASLKQQRGREVGVLLSVIEVVSIAGPVLGGFISGAFGFHFLFITAGILMLFAVYPLFKSPDIYIKHKFTLDNFQKVFEKHKANFFGYWGYSEDLMLQSLWPVVIFTTVPHFFGVGLISTVASLIATVLMLYIGRLTDSFDKARLLKYTSVIYGLTWIFRFLAKGLLGVVVFDAITKTGKGSINVPVISITYDAAGSSTADHAIAYSVFYEFSLSIGKIVTCLAGIVILSLGGSVYHVFALAGVLAMLYGLLRNK